MKKSFVNYYIVLVLSIFTLVSVFTGCQKTENPILYPTGTFPDSVINMETINSKYDDYNTGLYQLYGYAPIIFSSNRKSLGGQFDLEQAAISFKFDQTTGAFSLGADITDDGFLDKLINKAKTAGNDFGPYRLYSSLDGFEYLCLSSVNTQGDLDMYYLRNRPVYSGSMPDVEGPFPIRLFNTISDDAYICFDSNLDSAFFTTNKDGNFDIYLHKRPVDQDITTWFNQSYSASTKVDSINTTSDEKCPMVFKNVMLFTSNRPGGLGGYDLYYSLFRNKKWSSPVNLGPGINTSADEYRPVLGYHPDFKNLFMMFSSNRSGGLGGFDLYFTGIAFPVK